MANKVGAAGATLVEFLAATGVVSVLACVAVPGLTALQRDVVRTVTVNDFVHSLHLARYEAMKRNAVVSICRSRDGLTCANSLPDWNSGWIVFVNKDRDQPADTDPGEPILYRHDAIKSGVLTSNRKSFSYRSYLQGDVNGTVFYCPQAYSKDGRAIIVNHAGRARTSKLDASGKPISC